jgi:hypothetical protein
MRKRILTAALLLAACGQSPTAPANTGPGAAVFDSGPLGGSGNRVDPTGTTTTATPSMFEVADSAQAESGPLGGSGN